MRSKIRTYALSLLFTCTMGTLFAETHADADNTYYLNATQVEFISAHPQLLAYIGQLQNGLTPQQIATQYHLTPKSQQSYLSHLEKLKLITKSKDGQVALVFGTRPFSWKSTDEKLGKTVGMEMTQELHDTVMKKLKAGGKNDELNEFDSLVGFRLTDDQLKELNKEIHALKEKYFAISVENKNKAKEEIKPAGFYAATLHNWQPGVFTDVKNIDF